jgi:hypothetical protein
VDHSTITAIAYTTTDLDEYAAALSDLASAIDRRDSGDAADHLERIAASDPATADALTDWLTFNEMFEQEVTS